MFRQLKEDIACVKSRDPAARSALEIFFLYPGFKAIRLHRRAKLVLPPWDVFYRPLDLTVGFKKDRR